MSERADAALDAALVAAVRAYLGAAEPAPGLHARLVAALERPLLAQALAISRGNRSHAAAMLDLTRATLRRKLRAHGLAQD